MKLTVLWKSTQHFAEGQLKNELLKRVMLKYVNPSRVFFYSENHIYWTFWSKFFVLLFFTCFFFLDTVLYNINFQTNLFEPKIDL